MTDEEFKQLEEDAKNLSPEFQAIVEATTELEKEVLPGIIGTYNKASGGWVYTDPETGQQAVMMM